MGLRHQFDINIVRIRFVVMISKLFKNFSVRKRNFSPKGDVDLSPGERVFFRAGGETARSHDRGKRYRQSLPDLSHKYIFSFFTLIFKQKPVFYSKSSMTISVSASASVNTA